MALVSLSTKNTYCEGTMTIEIPVNKDTITNIAGAIGAVALAVQPIIDSTQGDFTINDASKIVLAAMVAILGWYSGKQQDGTKIPKGEKVETTPDPVVPSK
jgi:hypothetical protein